MSKVRTVSAIDIFSENSTIQFDYCDDNVCPICLFSSNELTADGYYSHHEEGLNFYVLKACPNCGKISLFKTSVSDICEPRTICSNHYDLTSYLFTTDTPINQKTDFSNEINSLSPRFVNIFNQSEFSEQSGYDEICGMGYRKAVEFLIKDFLCMTQPENADAIKCELLSESIKRISEDRIKILAQRCAWIGNDETHYIRKHKDYDVNTLKTFIFAVVHYIDAEVAFLSALEIQPK